MSDIDGRLDARKVVRVLRLRVSPESNGMERRDMQRRQHGYLLLYRVKSRRTLCEAAPQREGGAGDAPGYYLTHSQ